MGKGRAKRQRVFKAALNAAQNTEKEKLISALADFWHSAGFQRHWAHPPFSYHDVKKQIDSAADMVVRIRSHCASKHELPKTHAAGAAFEYLYSLHEMPNDVIAFENELVHACLMDSNGYTAPLDESLVNRYISEIRKLRQEAEEEARKPDVRAELEALHLLLDEIQPELERDTEATEQLLGKIRQVNDFMEQVAKRQKEVAEAARQHEEHLKAQQAAEAEAGSDDAEDEEEDDASSGEDSERSRMKASIERAQQQEKKMLQIKKIADNTSQISKDVRAFEEMDLPRLEQESMDPKERQGMLQRLTKRALEYGVKLERELLELDALQGEDVRPARKEQVLKIQEALRHVDRLQAELKKYQAKHEPPAAEEEEEQQQQQPPAQSEEQPKAEEQPQQQQVAKEPERKKPKEKPLLERFASLKLDPRFQVRDGRAGYAVSAYVPGLDEDALNISLNDSEDVLTCEGRRLPTEKELNMMRKQLRARYRYEPAEEDELLLRYGAGRFGSFSEKWRIDKESMDPQNIEASYQNGNIELFIPRRAPKQRYVQPTGRPGGFPGYGGRSPYGGSPFYF